MATNIFRPEEKLEGSTNYNSWKARLTAILEEKEALMPNITSLKTAKECFDTLMNLYEKNAPSQKRVLKKRL